jgi:hypothetical protein
MSHMFVIDIFLCIIPTRKDVMWVIPKPTYTAITEFFNVSA